MSSSEAQGAKYQDPSTPPPHQTTHNTGPPEESPRVNSLSHQGFTNATKMDVVREEVVYDLGPSIPEIPFEWFKGALLHRVEEDLVSEVCQKLKEENRLSDEGWTAMQFEKLNLKKGKTKLATQDDGQANEQQHQSPKDTTDSNAKINEITLFKPLPGILNRVLDILHEKKGGHKRVRFFSAPNQTLRSEGSHGQYKSDMVTLVEETRSVRTRTDTEKEEKNKNKKKEQGKEKEHECDVVLAAEFKTKVDDEQIDDNVSKVLGNINHIMGADPTRRFVYGMTIEHTNVRLWFCSRSHIFVTQILDLQKATLGTANNEALGFDPTAERVVSAITGDVGYRFVVDGEEYEVVEVISIYKAKFLLGRANRIFRVKRVLPSGELDSEDQGHEDVWIPQDAKTELEMRDHIKANINRNSVVEGLDPSAFDKHFVVIEKCEYVKVPSMKDPSTLVNDDSDNFLRGHDMPEHSRFVLKRTTNEYKKPFNTPATGTFMSATGGTPGSSYAHRAGTLELKKMAREHYGNKVHCRIVMEDAGKPLLAVRNLRTVIVCIIQVITGLMFMYSAGVVHRDISPGNILVTENDGKITAKLSDLEYAKDLSDHSSSQPRDIKTGTPFFMALEVEAGKHMFGPERNISTASRLRIQKARGGKIAGPSLFCTISESLFWILVYFHFAMHPVEDELNDEISDTRLRKFNTLFPYPGIPADRDPRIAFFKGIDPTLEEFIASVPARLSTSLEHIVGIAGDLKHEYRRIQENLNRHAVEQPVDLYLGAKACLEDLLDEDWGVWLGELVSLFDKASTGQKRKGGTITGGASAKKVRR
ncbi:hypothetical protein VNI00_015363 [Paramarasmius palmivorus]|uniref:Protein kinase domain-containing protein n=1 Tax=Paramarasmius palmivorus TaxID=297713 RepID=A0AAW0BMS5_9AGAR